MGPLGRFLLALNNMVKTGGIKKIDDAFNMAKQEFGEITPLLKKQIEKIFSDAKSPKGIVSLKRKPEGKVIEASFKPGRDKKGKVVEESPSQASGIMQRLEKQRDDLFNLLSKNPTRPGGGLDPTTGMARTAARVILNNAKINIPEKVDPLKVIADEYGADVLSDLRDVADELIMKEKTGITESMGEFLEKRGMFNLQRGRKDMPQSLSDEDLKEIEKAIEQEDILLKFDPKDREPNAIGGFNRANFSVGSGIKGLGALSGALRKIMDKFGKDSITTADKIAQPEKKTEVLVREFEARDRSRKEMDDIIKDQIEGGFIRDMEKSMQRDMQRELAKPTREILDVPEVPKGFKLSKEKLMDKFPEIDEDFADQMMGMNKDMQGRIIKMLENRRLDPEAYDRLLEQYGDTLEFQKEFDKVVRRKQNAEGGLNYLMGM